jgi:hypothetical protein
MSPVRVRGACLGAGSVRKGKWRTRRDSNSRPLPATRDVAYLIHLRLVDEKEGRLRLTTLGRERYHGLPNDAAMSDAKDEAAVVLRRHLLRVSTGAPFGTGR